VRTTAILVYDLYHYNTRVRKCMSLTRTKNQLVSRSVFTYLESALRPMLWYVVRISCLVPGCDHLYHINAFIMKCPLVVVLEAVYYVVCLATFSLEYPINKPQKENYPRFLCTDCRQVMSLPDSRQPEALHNLRMYKIPPGPCPSTPPALRASRSF
jgi:hypothetical protein